MFISTGSLATAALGLQVRATTTTTTTTYAFVRLFVFSFRLVVRVSRSCWVPASCSHTPSPRDPPLPSVRRTDAAAWLLCFCLFGLAGALIAKSGVAPAGVPFTPAILRPLQDEPVPAAKAPAAKGKVSPAAAAPPKVGQSAPAPPGRPHTTNVVP